MPLVLGLLGFLVIWGTLLVPQVLLHRARFGHVRPGRVAVTAAAVLYGCLALAAVLLPLPAPGDPGLKQSAQLVPFQWVSDVSTELGRYDSPVTDALASTAFQQATMNVLLFVPLGVIAGRLWRRRLAETAALGFVASLLVEVAQLTANFGTAPHPYRIFDVDDLINNTAGAVLGWVAAALALALWRPLSRTRSTGFAPPEPPTVPMPVGRPHPARRAAPAYVGPGGAPHGGLPTPQWRPRQQGPTSPNR